MKTQAHDSIDSIPALDWNAMAHNNPFLQHEFLGALEHSGCVSSETGWQPLHLTCSDERGCLIGAMPLYLKFHSYGEYVFDWTWAQAWEHAGLHYYPKLVAAIPFSPVTGPRILCASEELHHQVSKALINKIFELADVHNASSIHCLFPGVEEIQDWKTNGFIPRKGCQFHWHNLNYSCFDDYLKALSSKYRKKIKRERRRVDEMGITHRIYLGHQLNDRLLKTLWYFYGSTYAKRARHPYLNLDFFNEIAASMPDTLLVNFAFLAGEPVACAIFFQGADTIYGRHWGCGREFHSLHFDTCYYQGIEYCIRKGISHFNPGTQGEHKLARGFVPTETHSLHWVAETAFRGAIEDFLREETRSVEVYIQEAKQHLPFHNR